MLEEKLDKMLTSPPFPIAVTGIEALDSWFDGVSENVPLFKYIVNAKLGKKYSVIKVENLPYVCCLSQDEWDAILAKSRGLLRNGTLNGESESYVKTIITGQLPVHAREFFEPALGYLLQKLSIC